MANPIYLALKAEIAKTKYAEMTDAQVVAALNAPDPANPAPKPITLSGLMTKFSAGTLAKLRAVPSLPAFVEDVRRGDRAAVGNWLAVAAAGDATNPPVISGAEYAAAVAYLAETEPGPSIASRIFGPPVTVNDLAAARNL